MRLEAKVETGVVLEHQTALLFVRPAAHDHKRCQEAFYDEVLPQLLCIPDLPVFRFKGFTAARLGVDLRQLQAADGFGGVVVRGRVLLPRSIYSLTEVEERGGAEVVLEGIEMESGRHPSRPPKAAGSHRGRCRLRFGCMGCGSRGFSPLGGQLPCPKTL